MIVRGQQNIALLYTLISSSTRKVLIIHIYNSVHIRISARLPESTVRMNMIYFCNNAYEKDGCYKYRTNFVCTHYIHKMINYLFNLIFRLHVTNMLLIQLVGSFDENLSYLNLLLRLYVFIFICLYMSLYVFNDVRTILIDYKL